MSDPVAFVIFLAALGLAVGGFLAWRSALDVRVRAWLRESRRRFVRFISTNPYEPKAMLLQSSDGSITLARLKNGQLRRLRVKPEGKAARKQWKRLRRVLRTPVIVSASPPVSASSS